jgi:hypothetical protein
VGPDGEPVGDHLMDLVTGQIRAVTLQVSRGIDTAEGADLVDRRFLSEREILYPALERGRSGDPGILQERILPAVRSSVNGFDTKRHFVPVEHFFVVEKRGGYKKHTRDPVLEQDGAHHPEALGHTVIEGNEQAGPFAARFRVPQIVKRKEGITASKKLDVLLKFLGGLERV